MNTWMTILFGGAVAATTASAMGQAPAPQSHMSVHDQAALVDQYCSDCHSGGEKSGNLSLVLTSNAGAKYTVTVVQGPQLSIAALSSCFPTAGLSGMKSY